jgi:hypothetical protein
VEERIERGTDNGGDPAVEVVVVDDRVAAAAAERNGAARFAVG